MFVSGLFTCDMGFTLALSSILVATGNSCWGADDANVTAVTADAAIRIWGFKTIPTRQTIGTLTTCYCKLTLTLTSYLEVRNTEGERDGKWREKKQVLNLKTYKLSKLKLQGFHWWSTIFCLFWCVPGHTPCCRWLFQQCDSCMADTHQGKWDQIPSVWKTHWYTAHSSSLTTKKTETGWDRPRKSKR